MSLSHIVPRWVRIADRYSCPIPRRIECSSAFARWLISRCLLAPIDDGLLRCGPILGAGRLRVVVRRCLQLLPLAVLREDESS